MTLLCFLLDLRSIPPPLLHDLKQSLLQLANLYAVACGSDETSMLRDLIGLCYINSIKSPELKIAYRPGQSFSLRDFHHAVNNLPMNCILPNEPMPTGNDHQEVSLTELFSNKALYTWGGDDITKKLIAIATTAFSSTEAFWKSIVDAAERCVMLEFLVLEQEDINLLSDTAEKLSGFINRLNELDNCILHRYLPDKWVLCGLVKRWLHELRKDMEEPLQAIFSFKNTIAGSINQISCMLAASTDQIIDGFTHCQVCRCHGQPTSNAITNKTGSFCSITKCDLRASEITETAVKVGQQTVLFLPSFESSPKLRRICTPINFNVIERTDLASLNEAAILGTSYVVTPTCHQLVHASNEGASSELNAQIFHGLCGALFHLDQGLVCSSTCNTETRMNGAFHCFYLLQPSDRGPMLLRRLAGAEEVLPIPSMVRLNGMVIPEEIKNSINASLSMVDVRDYNPLEHERGFHPKMNWLVKESLHVGSILQRTDKSTECNSPAPQQDSEEMHPNRSKDESSSSCTAKEWERLLIVDEFDDDYSFPSVPKPKMHNPASTQSKTLDDKTSRILERLEAPRQLNAAIGGQLKKPLLPFEPGASQPMRPHFQKPKRKREGDYDRRIRRSLWGQ